VRDLRERLVSLLQRLGATQDPSPLADDLLAAWSEPDRAYHDVRHLEDCLEQVDGLPVETATHDLVEAALWFHDAIYDPRSSDNEERSARWASEALAAAGVAAPVGEEIARLVRLTGDHAPVPDEAGRFLLDIDLSILGRPAEVFEAYQRRIRTEYRWVPEGAYRLGRGRVLARFLRRDPLFQTELYRTRFERTARANLRRALAELETSG
jgi:predicted metal-dependent HD superfamily phosphohydrolase